MNLTPLVLILTLVLAESIDSGLSLPVIVEPITQLEPISASVPDPGEQSNKYDEKQSNNSIFVGATINQFGNLNENNQNNNNINNDNYYNNKLNDNNNNSAPNDKRSHACCSAPTLQIPEIEPLRLVKLIDPEVTCNDGSPIGYYMRLNNHSKSWVIYLEGGGFCGNEQSCQRRWQRTPDYMSSDNWPATRMENGILSGEPATNPYLWNANHIYIGYCTSDSYTGSRLAHGANSRSGFAQDKQNNKKSFAFMGSKVIERVLESLFENLTPELSLYEAKSILLAGESAGAAGVILNLDKIRDFILNKAANSNSYLSRPMPIVRGLADSGWFVDNELEDFEGANQISRYQADPFNQYQTERTEWDCEEHLCSPKQTIRQAMNFWRGQVPKACSNKYPKEPSLCYFGYRTYQTLETPLFVVQWLYDDYQLISDKLVPVSLQQQESADSPYWQNIMKVGRQVRQSLENVTALFAPSCLSHSMITRDSWNQIYVNGFRLPHVLNRWEEQSLASHFVDHIQLMGPGDIGGQTAVQASSFSTQAPGLAITDNVIKSSQHQSQATNLKHAKAMKQTSSNEALPPDLFAASTARPKVPIKKKRRTGHARPRLAVRLSNYENSDNQQSNNHLHKQKPDHHTRSLIMNQLEESNSHSSSSLMQESKLSPSSASSDDTNPSLTNLLLNESIQTSSGTPTSAGYPSKYGPVSANGWYLFNGNHEQSPLRLILINESTNESSKLPIDNGNSFRLIDSCSWPQCNRNCPKLNPYLHARLISPYFTR